MLYEFVVTVLRFIRQATEAGKFSEAEQRELMNDIAQVHLAIHRSAARIAKDEAEENAIVREVISKID